MGGYRLKTKIAFPPENNARDSRLRESDHFELRGWKRTQYCNCFDYFRQLTFQTISSQQFNWGEEAVKIKAGSKHDPPLQRSQLGEEMDELNK